MPPRLPGSVSLKTPHISEWNILHEQIVSCRLCPRLVRFREEIGEIRRRAFREQEYWSKPLPGFGDRKARVAVIGLAPAAHGGNRTGRVFTGDRSADFLIRAMWLNGFANQPTSLSRDDRLVLRDAFITMPVRCAPPDNKPTREEFATCSSYLVRELDLLTDLRVVVALGSLALNAYLDILKTRHVIASRAPFRFGHGARYLIRKDEPVILASYHPSQQNTFTGRLTLEMLSEVFAHAREIAGSSADS